MSCRLFLLCRATHKRIFFISPAQKCRLQCSRHFYSTQKGGSVYEAYRNCGYYCPAILCSKKGGFPTVSYKSHRCVAYAEEYHKYHEAKERFGEACGESAISEDEIRKETFLMTAKIAAKRLDFADYPSAYCPFDTFCPSDATDEVLENALEWKKYTATLSSEFQAQIQRIWRQWNDNREKLQEIYADLPTSIFQADLNLTNVLLDDNGNFVGIFDFNLCGKDVFLNYLFREIPLASH